MHHTENFYLNFCNNNVWSAIIEAGVTLEVYTIHTLNQDWGKFITKHCFSDFCNISNLLTVTDAGVTAHAYAIPTLIQKGGWCITKHWFSNFCNISRSSVVTEVGVTSQVYTVPTLNKDWGKCITKHCFINFCSISSRSTVAISSVSYILDPPPGLSTAHHGSYYNHALYNDPYMWIPILAASIVIITATISAYLIHKSRYTYILLRDEK